MSTSDEIKAQWMQWDEIASYKEQLVELEIRLIQQYHYPDMTIPKEYCQNSVESLETHLRNGNTFFWGATKNDVLLGYYWAYTTLFLNRKRWILRSLMIREEYQKTGLGSLAMREGINKAKKENCIDMSTEYVPWNKSAAELYNRFGFQISRIEIVKKL